ncbi:MAG: hypothetical protein RLZZ126_94 [Pseudomonadota bacterium]|jgi:glycosyltransferase involved in cell wall biosynthesis
MHILYHHRTASRDGQAVHIDEMIAAMRSLGHTVQVVAPEVGAAASGGMGGGLGWVQRMRAMLPKAAYELLELLYSWVAVRRLLSAAKDRKPDFIYERYNLFLLAGVWAKQKLEIPLILEVNAPLVQERSLHSDGLSFRALARWAEAKVWRSADLVLPVTEVLASHVRAVGVPDTRILVLANGINREHFSDVPALEQAKQALGLQGKTVLGFTGFVRSWHGVDRVVTWLAGPASPADAFLLVVGDGPERAPLEALARTLKVDHKVRFTGVIDRADVPRHVAAFDVALQPAVTAYASPLKLMEYLVLGKAVVAPDEPNLLEILRHDDNALIFSAKDPAGLESALSVLCADSALRERLGQRARATIAEKRLTWVENASRVAERAAAV